jgi:DnaJ family protein B protein 4
MSSSYYQILGVTENATDNEIKKKYHKLSLQYHPDKNSDRNAKDTYLKIQEAYEVLGDPMKRKEYDERGNGLPPMGGPGFTFPTSFRHQDIPQHFQNIFETMAQQQHAGFPFFQFLNRPPPIVQMVEVTLDQLYHGCTLDVPFTRWIMEQNAQIYHKEISHFTIPAGAEHNQTFIFREQGNRNGPMIGDVKLVLQQTPHALFQRIGHDLIYNAKITLKQALCGFSLQIQHFDGKLLTVNNRPPCGNIIIPESEKVVPDLGMPIPEATKKTGSLRIRFQVAFPKQLSLKQMNALNTLLPDDE